MNNEQPTFLTIPQPPIKKSHKGIKVTAVVFLILLLCTAVGYGAYAWSQNNILQANATSKDSKIQDLNKQLAALSSQKQQTIKAPVDPNVIAIRELGVSLTVPDALKDLTYSYSGKYTSDGYEGLGVNFSTVSITDQDKDCSSSGAAPPLGGLIKVNGNYTDAGTPPGQLIKQFSGYYIAYSTPESNCSAQQTSEADTFSSLQSQLKDALSTVREL